MLFRSPNSECELIRQEGARALSHGEHLSYFVLTHGLCERLAASAPTRIVSTSSDAHESAALDFEHLQSKKVYSSGSIGEWLRYGGPGFKVYSRSKLCNILLTRELARRAAALGVTANSFHPGFVATRFGDQSGGLISFGIRVGKRFALTPEEGAKTLVYLASSDEVSGVNGKYFHKCRAVEPSARRLWKETAKLAGLEDLSD